MNKEKIIMVDYWSVTDRDGQPIGHGCKVGNEYYHCIKGTFNVVQYVNISMLPFIENPGKIKFSNSVKSGVGKLTRIWETFRCLSEVYKHEKESVIWFYVSDIYLYLFLLIMRKGRRKIGVNMFEEYIGSKIKNWIFRKAQKKVDVAFVTNKILMQNIPNGIFIPDYAYNAEIYGIYQKLEKREQAVCLGTMNEKKLLEEAVEVFSQNGYPLYIAGQFSSEEAFKKLCEKKAANIIIENRYVDSEEYYQLLGSSKYSLVPYDAAFYKNRTSGVIQECLFCNTVPISHREILEFNNVQGVGYENISDLETCNLKAVDVSAILETYEKERQCFYNYETIRDKMIAALAMTMYYP